MKLTQTKSRTTERSHHCYSLVTRWLFRVSPLQLISELSDMSSCWAICKQPLSTIICWGLVLYGRSLRPAVASLIIFLMCGHGGFTRLFLAQSRALERSEVQLQKTRNLRTAEAPQRSNQWAIRFPLIYLAWLDVDVNQSHISVMVFLLIASLRSGCIPFRLWSLSANEVRKAYGSCFQPGSAESLQGDRAGRVAWRLKLS